MIENISRGSLSAIEFNGASSIHRVNTFQIFSAKSFGGRMIMPFPTPINTGNQAIPSGSSWGI